MHPKAGKYLIWYYKIINRAKTRSLEGYKENHHIIPKSLGGDDSVDNLVELTAREHFICHQLLTKFLDGSEKTKMMLAMSFMTGRSKTHNRDYKVRARVYETIKLHLSNKQKMLTSSYRNLCKQCGHRPVGINYYKEGKTYYRSKCDHCARGYEKQRPRWAVAGYKKKSTCDRCGYTSKYEEQFDVYYVDGDLSNCRFTNLKTVCANCQRVLHKLNLPWRRGDLIADF